MRLPVVVLGGGGHAKVVIDTLLQTHTEILGYTCVRGDSSHPKLLEIPCIGDDEAVKQYKPDLIRLIHGVGSVDVSTLRSQIFDRFSRLGYKFDAVIHPFTSISAHARILDGVQVMAGAVVNANTEVGRNSIINTRASVDHDCLIGDHVHIAPGVTISGGVQVGNGSQIGTGASVIQGVRIGANCLIGAGALVLHDVPDGAVVYGVPGKER
jgi:sugar O-acyltransferase (sialic acid O-acetyltransferase NeuD family)